MEISPRQTCEDLVMLVGHVKAGMLHIAEAHNLTPVQFFALQTISRGGVTMGRVADTMHCDASNVTGIVDRLVAMELVTRSESEHDRRAKTLKLTKAGQQLIDKVLEELPKQLGCTSLNSSEQQVLHTAIIKLTRTA